MAALSPVQPFSEWLAATNGGTLDAEITAALYELVQAVQAQERKGTLKVELTVETIGSGKRSVIIRGKTSVKLPEPAPDGAIFYVGEGGSLHRDDPFQGSFDTDTRKLPEDEPRALPSDHHESE